MNDEVVPAGRGLERLLIGLREVFGRSQVSKKVAGRFCVDEVKCRREKIARKPSSSIHPLTARSHEFRPA